MYRTDHELIDWYPGSSSIDMASSVTKILNMSHEINLALPGSVGSSMSLVTYLEGLVLLATTSGIKDVEANVPATSKVTVNLHIYTKHFFSSAANN